MSGFYRFVLFMFFLAFWRESVSIPLKEGKSKALTFRAIVPSLSNPREKRAEAEGGGIGEAFTNVIKDGAQASTALESPTMMIGSFSMMMQRMPHGGELANLMLEKAPQYMSLLPGIGRK